MRFMTYAVLLWALTVRALVNGEFETAILEMHNTEIECNESKDRQHIIGDCLEAEAIGPADAI